MIDQQPDNVLEAGTTTKYETTKTIGATTTNTATVSYVDPAGYRFSHEQCRDGYRQWHGTGPGVPDNGITRNVHC